MKTYQVDFYSFNAIVEAENEEEAEKEAFNLLYQGILNIEVSDIKETEENPL